MIQLKMKYIMLVAFILVFTGCDKLIYEQETGNEPTVYLSVSTRAAHTNGEESINEDNEDFEDRVHDLAMLIFDTGSGQKIVEYFGSNLGTGVSSYAFTAELTPGQRDFYFVANRPNMPVDLQAISSRTEMEAYMNNIHDLDADLYLNATDTKGFPMARIYLNQTVSPGGTLYQPERFRPVVGGTAEDNVKLIRVVAKLEVIFNGAADLGVDKIYFRNANRHFRLTTDPDVAEPTAFFNGNLTDTELKRIGTTNTYVYYMPEAIVPSSRTWSNTGNNEPINYFTIETTNGEKYDIPIISNETSITADYLAKAKGTVTGYAPNYNIYRNRHYKYVVRNLQQIEVIYEIDPWNVVNKFTYMGYGYNVEVDDDGNITITNTIDDCMPHKVRLVTRNGAYFGTPGSTTVEYGFESETDADYDEQKSKAGYSEGFQVNKDAVADGEPYLEVYYNKVPGTGVTPDKVFTK